MVVFIESNCCGLMGKEKDYLALRGSLDARVNRVNGRGWDSIYTERIAHLNEDVKCFTANGRK